MFQTRQENSNTDTSATPNFEKSITFVNGHQTDTTGLSSAVNNMSVSQEKLEKLFCEKHVEFEMTHFCRKCEVPVCASCRSSEIHKGHRTKRIGVAVTERKNKLVSDISLQNDRYKDLLGKLASTEDEKVSIRSSCDEVVARVRQRCAYMKNIIDTAANNLVKEVYHKKKDCIQQYTTCQKEIQKELKDTECVLDFMHYLSEIQDTKAFLEGYKELEPKPSTERKLPEIWKEYVSFEHGSLSAKELQERFGAVSFVAGTDGGAFTYDNKHYHRRLSCKTKRSFKCVRRKQVESDDEEQDDGPINSISKYNDELWVSCGVSWKQIAKVDKAGKTIKTTRLQFKAEDISTEENGDLIVSSFQGKALKRVTQDMDITDVLDIPLHPTGIASTKDGGYLVCMCDSFSTSICEESRRLVVKYKQDGQEVRTYEYDGENRLFTRPYRVAENVNGDICVIDKTSMGTGQVVILDRYGNLTGSYHGNKQTFTDKNQYSNISSEFSPTDIACDSNGRIFITEPDSHKIHILTSKCDYIGHLLTNESDFFCPKCITTDKHNQIWVGNEYGEIKMFTCDWE